MEDFFKKMLVEFKRELENSSKLGSKHPTDVAHLREETLKKYIMNIFPYYEPFKGNVADKSCDLILCQRDLIPRFSILGTDGFNPITLLSCVDTIIDMKFDYSYKELLRGIDQSFAIKSKYRKPISIEVFGGKIKSPLNHWQKWTARHGLVFKTGKNENVIKNILKYIETKKNNLKISVDEIFYKLPDFIYLIDENTLIFSKKTNDQFLSMPFMGVHSLKNGFNFFLLLIEHFANENNPVYSKRVIMQELIDKKTRIELIKKGIMWNVSLSALTEKYQNKNIFHVSKNEKNSIEEAFHGEFNKNAPIIRKLLNIN